MLVVGDPALCDGIIERLRTAGHDVDHALHGEDAIVYLQVRPDCTLVLASLDLPGHRGRSLLQTLSQEFPGVPIISFAARRCARRIARAFRNGAFDFSAGRPTKGLCCPPLRSPASMAACGVRASRTAARSKT
jgi:DNA-binding response OmpR family regulator